MWAPAILTMDELVNKITGLTIEEPVALLLDFYATWSNLQPQPVPTFEEFLKWATTLLKDFDDIDASTSNPSWVFSNLLDAKRIENWNPDGSPRTEFQENYLKFIAGFNSWHQEFQSTLLKRKTAYKGLALRQAVTALETTDGAVLPWQQLIFAGFNALTRAEEEILRFLLKRKRAEIFWDSDIYYLQNKEHEAGHFLREYKRNWGIKELSFTGDHFSKCKKNIEIYGVAKYVNQAKLAAQILQHIPTSELSEQQTAVVLANEALLFPVLNSIPENIEKVNVTMGFPLRKTSIYGFFEAFFQIHITLQRTKGARADTEPAFYFKDVVRFFNHPAMNLYLQKHFAGQPSEAFINRIYQSKRSFLYFKSMAEIWGDAEGFTRLLGPVFLEPANNAGSLVSGLKDLCVKLDETYRWNATQRGVEVESTPWFIDFEALFSLRIIIEKLDSYIGSNSSLHDTKSVFMLFQALVRDSKLTLSGEPLTGLQIMGMLETRNLDFKNVIILSANEDILPAARAASSLVPSDVKKHSGMPTFRERDALYAYNFYRLLQRAENIHIIYNTQTQDLGSSEKSRYITQLQMELPRWNPEIRIRERIIPIPASSENIETEISIPKTPDISEKLFQINQKGFSPTTLQHYIKCSLFFYFRHIAGIEEAVAPEETIQANTLGTVVHRVLEQLYDEAGLKGKNITPEHIEKMFMKVAPLTRKSFEEVYEGGDIDTGKNLLLTRVAIRYVSNFLTLEKEFLEKLKKENINLRYITSEEPLLAELPLQINDNINTIKLRGFADRIDQLGETIRIIDYKTGAVKPDELKIEQWPDTILNPDFSKAFQLLMYALLYEKMKGNNKPVIPGIFSFRNLSAGLFTLTTPVENAVITGQSVEHFKNLLIQLLQEIFSEQPFVRTENTDSCLYCEFRKVCSR